MTTAQESPAPEAEAGEPETPPDLVAPPQPDRRTVLLGIAAGAVAGGVAEYAVHDLHPVRWLADHLGEEDGSVRVHGGNDTNEARRNTLAVWNARPATTNAGRVAHYFPVGSSSNDQVDIIRNKLAAAGSESDLVVIDPEYLPGLVGDNLVAELPDGTGLARMLQDEGCFASLLARCRVRDDENAPLYALPLNADAPMLVMDLSLFPEAARRPVRAALGDAGHDPAEFWRLAQGFALKSTGPKETQRIMVQSGHYEGMTVSLVELLHAFGGDVKADPTLSSQSSREALNVLRQTFPPEVFTAPLGETGDEEGTLLAMQEHRTAFARLWPSQVHQLMVDTATEETGTRAYEAVPIPGGVLGGQVVAMARNSTARAATVDLATFLARGQGQSQLFHVGGYVPTLGPVFFETTVRDQLHGVPDALNTAVQRPYIRQYGPWSSAFREQVRPYLLGQSVDVNTSITRNLRAYVTD